MELNNTHIGLRIKKIREKEGLTKIGFAEAIGLDNSTLGKVEAGKQAVTLATALEISSKFGVNLDWLLAGGAQEITGRIQSADSADLLLLILQEVKNSKAQARANAELLQKVLSYVSKKSEAEISAEYRVTFERFLAAELSGLK